MNHLGYANVGSSSVQNVVFSVRANTYGSPEFLSHNETHMSLKCGRVSMENMFIGPSLHFVSSHHKTSGCLV